MTHLQFTSELPVKLVQHIGSDDMIVHAARVSTGAQILPIKEEEKTGLIRYLMRKKHGSPFEHNSITFRAEVPLFVRSEWERHRIGWSYNEMSGRYTKFEPKFYRYPDTRPLVQEGSGAHPKLGRPGGPLLHQINGELTAGAQSDWRRYERMLELGAANEVARPVLPTGTYTMLYATCNVRSLMNFLTLRVDSEDNTFETKPLWEIEQVALQMEAEFARLFPVTHAAFVEYGRVAP